MCIPNTASYNLFTFVAINSWSLKVIDVPNEVGVAREVFMK